MIKKLSTALFLATTSIAATAMASATTALLREEGVTNNIGIFANSIANPTTTAYRLTTAGNVESGDVDFGLLTYAADCNPFTQTPDPFKQLGGITLQTQPSTGNHFQHNIIFNGTTVSLSTVAIHVDGSPNTPLPLIDLTAMLLNADADPTTLHVISPS